MTQTLFHSPPSLIVATRAQRAAEANTSANVSALQESQPRLANAIDAFPSSDMDWLFARDGALTVMDAAGRWWAGCSLPTRAAKFMFAKADLSGIVVCMLTPAHAAQIRVALDQMRPGQAMLALVPEITSFRILLGCDDFSAEIATTRLFFAWGEEWGTELDLLLEENPGLPTPSQFVRPILADSSAADALMPLAQKIFSDHAARRTEKTREIRAGWVRRSLRLNGHSAAGTLAGDFASSKNSAGEGAGGTENLSRSPLKICLVAPSHFRLWDDTGSSLAAAMASGIDGIGVLRFDSDNPASASPLALAMAAAQCDAIVTPNLGRGDLPDLAPDDMPWATWLTIPRIPSAAAAGLRDALLVADPAWKDLAIEKGWNASRVFVAGWPANKAKSAGDPLLAIISDTRPLDPPASVTEYSSHRLLWEAIQNELLNDPFQCRGSADDYLAGRIRNAGLERDGLDRAAFIDGLIKHAYQQGIAALLLAEKIPLKLFGHGWDQLDSFAASAAGAIQSREDLHNAVESARALVHVWPTSHIHPIESFGKPVIRAHHRRDSFIRDARLALAGKLASPIQSGPALTAEGLVAALSL